MAFIMKILSEGKGGKQEMSSGEMKYVSAAQRIKIIYENNWTYKCILVFPCHSWLVFRDYFHVLLFNRKRNTLSLDDCWLDG